MVHADGVDACSQMHELWMSQSYFFFFKQKTAYEIVSRDWSSDVCSSDLPPPNLRHRHYRSVRYHQAFNIMEPRSVAGYGVPRDRKSVV